MGAGRLVSGLGSELRSGVGSGALILLLALAGTASATAQNSGYYGYGIHGRSNHVEKPADRELFSFDALAKMIREKELRSIDEIVPLLPTDVRNRYVMMYRSRSLQKASFQKPRAIVFEGDASFIAGFNDESLPGGNTLEVIQFREAERKWEFREISFPKDGGRPVISNANPRKCLECHQSPSRVDVDPRPNWEPYSNWPGAYAGIDGRLTETYAGYNSRYIQPQDAPMVEPQSHEKDELKIFEEVTKPARPRYRALGPFSERNIDNFTDIVVGTNDVRVARLMSQTRDWDVYKPYLLSAAFCADDYSSDMWARQQARQVFMDPAFPDELAPVLVPTALEIVRSESMPYERRNVDQLARVYFEARGVDTRDWSTDFRTGGRMAFQARFGTPSSPYPQFKNALVEVFGDKAASCQDLRQEMLTSLPALRASGRLSSIAAQGLEQGRRLQAMRANEPARLLQKCASCHGKDASDADAPAIPFDDISLLKAKLATGGYKRGALIDEIAYRVRDFSETGEQMPPTGAWSPQSRAKLVEYLRGL